MSRQNRLYISHLHGLPGFCDSWESRKRWGLYSLGRLLWATEKGAAQHLWSREIVLGLGLRSSSLWKGHLRRLKVTDRTGLFQDIPWCWRIPCPHSPSFCAINFKVINGSHHCCFHRFHPPCLQKLCGLQLLNHKHQLLNLKHQLKY